MLFLVRKKRQEEVLDDFEISKIKDSGLVNIVMVNEELTKMTGLQFS